MYSLFSCLTNSYWNNDQELIFRSMYVNIKIRTEIIWNLSGVLKLVIKQLRGEKGERPGYKNKTANTKVEGKQQ
jgi:hypothetical protein